MRNGVIYIVSYFQHKLWQREKLNSTGGKTSSNIVIKIKIICRTFTSVKAQSWEIDKFDE